MNCSEVTPNPGKKINQFCKVVGDQQVNACTIYIDVLVLQTHSIHLLNPSEHALGSWHSRSMGAANPLEILIDAVHIAVALVAPAVGPARLPARGHPTSRAASP